MTLRLCKTDRGLAPQCGNCRFFLDDPAQFEHEFPGILALSSGQGDTRGDQGLCLKHKQVLTPRMTCPGFELRPELVG